MRVRPLANLLVAIALPAQACSVAPGWKPPTPEEAFAAANIVVHARVLSQSGANTDDVVAHVAVIRTWKGSFLRSIVRTASGAIPVASAAAALIENRLKDHFAVALEKGREVPVPLPATAAAIVSGTTP